MSFENRSIKALVWDVDRQTSMPPDVDGEPSLVRATVNEVVPVRERPKEITSSLTLGSNLVPER